jgi:pimeloyl-ACP methyl ester carboxylesterase
MTPNNSDIPPPERYITIDGCKIRYLDYDRQQHTELGGVINSFPILLLLHGIGASLERWLQVAPELAKHYRVIIPDIIGFGYSCKPNTDYTIDFFIDFLEKFLQNINIIIDKGAGDGNDNGISNSGTKINIIGSSFGGLLAAEFTYRFSNKIDKLVLVSPAGSSMPSPTPAFDFYKLAAHTRHFDHALKAFRSMFYNPDLATAEMAKEFIKRMYEENAILAFDSTLFGIARHIRDSQNLRQKLSKIHNPTLIIWGRNDHIIPFEYQLLEYLEIPNANAKIINECGHVPFVEKPNEFNETVLDFLLNCLLKVRRDV